MSIRTIGHFFLVKGPNFNFDRLRNCFTSINNFFIPYCIVIIKYLFTFAIPIYAFNNKCLMIFIGDRPWFLCVISEEYDGNKVMKAHITGPFKL